MRGTVERSATVLGCILVEKLCILWTANDPDSAVLQGAEPGRSGFVLDNAYYEHGIRARRDAHIRLAELDDRFDDINDRVDDLLRTLVDILDEHDEHDERERGDR